MVCSRLGYVEVGGDDDLCGLPDAVCGAWGEDLLLTSSRASTAASPSDVLQDVSVSRAQDEATKVVRAISPHPQHGAPRHSSAQQTGMASASASPVAGAAAGPRGPVMPGSSVIANPRATARGTVVAGKRASTHFGPARMHDLGAELCRNKLHDLLTSFSMVTGRLGTQKTEIDHPPTGLLTDSGRPTPKKVRTKVEAKRFGAPLCSFEELINVESSPTPLWEAVERNKAVMSGPCFRWDKIGGRAECYGGMLHIIYDVILWCENTHQSDMKTRISTSISFYHQPGCAYIFQPVMPLTVLVITPKALYRPMFELDPRSFHTLKLAWRHFLDFGVGDYRLLIGEQLERWTMKCKEAIQRPMDLTYWLMVMVGSYYREVLAQRRVFPMIDNAAERTPVVCVDTLVALSALLFTPDKHILFAGVNPPPAYLKWLQSVGDMQSKSKGKRTAPDRTQRMMFAGNEFLDLSPIIVFYGKIGFKTSSWRGNPGMVKGFIAKFMEDNQCRHQFEQAVRLYTQTCALGGKKVRQEDGTSKVQWFCWNGLPVCEVGVPMPCTQASYFSPFFTVQHAATQCPEHGPGAKPPTRSRHAAASSKQDSSEKPDASPDTGRASEVDGSRDRNRSGSQQTPSSTSLGGTPGMEPDNQSELCADSDSHSVRSDFAGGNRSSLLQPTLTSDDRSDEDGERRKRRKCSCELYIPHGKKAQTKKSRKRQEAGVEHEEIQEVLKNLCEFDLLHGFAAILACGLNVSKQFIRLHYSIGPGAYANLPGAAKVSWQDPMLQWYESFLQPDAHGRSRHSILVERMIHGILGDGFTSGKPFEVLDLVRSSTPKMGLLAMSDKGNSKPAASTAKTAAFGKPDSRQQAIIDEMALWSQLYESESWHTSKAHFDSFTQWCHAAQLVPFLQRCYRRCGIAGLLPGARSGRHKYGADPAHPLVLPTMRNFCYGHCYPLHRVLQYFYAGLNRLICSTDDLAETEALRQELGTGMPGQERVNNHCWFQLAMVDLPDVAPADDPATALANQLKAVMKDNLSPKKSIIITSERKSLVQKRQSTKYGDSSKSRQSTAAVTSAKNSGRPSTISLKQSVAGQKPQARRREKDRHGVLGVLTPTDPFFWFCANNFSAHAFDPAASSLPRHLLNDASGLVCRYTDVISRAGSPEPKHEESQALGEEDSAWDVKIPSKDRPLPVPPSVNLCQPTDLSAHSRERWQVAHEVADDRGFLLGDAGLWPGASGYRFTFEAMCENIDRFRRLSFVPTTQLLYIEHAVLPPKSPAEAHQKCHLELSDSSDDEGPQGGAPPSRRRRRRRLGEPQPSGDGGAAGETPPVEAGMAAQGVEEVMLPPLMHGSI